MDKLGADSYNYNFDRHGCWIEFRYKGELYRFDHSTEKAKARGIELRYGSDAFAQVVLALEDLARMVERGIYELSTWVAGMKYLPSVIEVPSFFQFLGFEQVPSGSEEVDERYRQLAKVMHPDAGGSAEDFQKLKDAAEKGKQYFGRLKS
ncbi:MAG: J domain-containing protein [Bacillota bacterium]|nr:J domain-containing protein [Bacillota bacterium]